jgi:hypothetical protein
MKKLLSLLVIAGLFAVVACGPSAEELAAKAKQKADSIKNAMTEDSLAKAAQQKHIEDSIAQVKEQQKKDSIAQAEANKKGGKTKAGPAGTKTTPKDKVKAGQGKG